MTFASQHQFVSTPSSEKHAQSTSSTWAQQTRQKARYTSPLATGISHLDQSIQIAGSALEDVPRTLVQR
jgi:hypothetical protein